MLFGSLCRLDFYLSMPLHDTEYLHLFSHFVYEKNMLLPTQQTGRATAKGGHPDISGEKQSWFDLPGTEHRRLNEPLMQYLAQNILSNRQPAEDQWSDPAHQLSLSEERIPDQFEEWLQGLGDIDVQKRMGGEFYEDYAANDEREQGTFPEANPGLSRNRNKAFEAMNQELKGFQHIKPHGDAAGSDLWSQYPQTGSRKKIGSMPLVPDRPPIGNLRESCVVAALDTAFALMAMSAFSVEML